LTRQELAKAIANLCILDGQYETVSGARVDGFFDKYRFEANPVLLGHVTEKMAEILGPVDPEQVVIAGIEIGGIPIATMMSHTTRCQTVFLRHRQLSYGTMKLLEGASVEDKDVILVEDVVFSGKTILSAASTIRSSGGRVKKVICVVERDGEGRSIIGAAGLEFHSVFTFAELIDLREAARNP
jgi:orotate phosphoribosyltransferase